jgi:hypothetical protein
MNGLSNKVGFVSTLKFWDGKSLQHGENGYTNRVKTNTSLHLLSLKGGIEK